MIGLGRPLIVDPMWPRKVEQGRQAISVRASGAIRDVSVAFAIPGSVPLLVCYNPQAGRELVRPLIPAGATKTVVVVGGGPAGCEAARVAALRGHRVVVLEKNEMGGQFNLASVPPGKSDFGLLPAFYINELDRLGVETRTGGRSG